MAQLYRVLKLQDMFLNWAFRVRPTLWILSELRNFLIVFESFTARLEKVLRVVDVGLLELTVCLLGLRAILLVVFLQFLTFQLSLIII